MFAVVLSAAAIAVCGGLCACNTVEGLGQDIGNVGESLQKSSRNK